VHRPQAWYEAEEAFKTLVKVTKGVKNWLPLRSKEPMTVLRDDEPMKANA